MTIKYGHFAITPQMCDMCGRTFIFERYSTRYKEIGIGRESFEFPICKKCTDEIINNLLTNTIWVDFKEKLWYNYSI